MIRLANLSIRKPKGALIFWVAVAGIFTAIGLGVTNQLSPTMTFTPGTESTEAEKLAEEEFGPSTLVPVLLVGPQAQLDRQGPALVRELAARARGEPGASSALSRNQRRTHPRRPRSTVRALLLAGAARSGRGAVGARRHARAHRGLRPRRFEHRPLDRQKIY